jgi:hypothetical protein
MSFKHLTPAHTIKMRQAVAEMSGIIAVAQTIKDPVLSASIVSKTQYAIDELKARYAEIENEDGTVLVKHPAIGYVTVDEALCEEPVRLFASKVQSLSTNRIRLYGADALVGVDGNVTYVNRKLIIDVEMTQMAFASLLANPGRGEYAATIRELNGVPVSYDGDLNSKRGKLMFNESLNSTEGMAQWAVKLVEQAQEAANKGGTLSKGARAEMDKNAEVLSSWTESNPAFYAQLLADFTASTTTDMKMEIMSATKFMGKK